MSTRLSLLVFLLGAVSIILGFSVGYGLADQSDVDLDRLTRRVQQLETPAPRPSPRADRARPQAPALLPAAPSHLPRSRVQGNGQQRGTRLRWDLLAKCESSGNPKANTGNGYYGAYQFDLATWRSVGGTGYPHQASLAEQTLRAQRLYDQRGAQPWPECGRWLR